MDQHLAYESSSGSKSDDALRVTEIFCSLQGESKSVGLPTVFVRLTGCPLRCQYCDTAYAFSGGQWMSIDEMMSKVHQYDIPWVTVTGGEPLAQKNCLSLLTRLCDWGYQVSLETSGAVPVNEVDPRVVKVMDVKTPGSGEVDRNILSNLECLTPQDQIKFVVCDERDYRWAKNFIKEHQISEKCEALMSPSYGQMEPATLAEWILQDRLLVRFQLQLHKLLWGDEPGR
ncbi:MAG: 7-carboxy-7-deazaguanine synthase QueE [Gammaproteobacteria bacterium]